MRKNIILILFIILIFIAIIFLIIEPNNQQSNQPIFNIKSINTTSSSIELNIDNSNNLSLNYSLLQNEEIIKNDIVNNNTIKINNLEANSNYKIKIFNGDKFLENEITTDKITTIRFGGDVFMDLYYADFIARYSVDYMWEDVNDLFQSADYSLVNLETSISTKGASNKPVGYGFRSHPDTLKGLVNAGIDFVSIANNHVFDYGVDAFYDTLKHLDEYKIQYAGAGQNIDEAFKINYQTINDLKIAFISASSVLGNPIWEATENKVGLAALKPHNYEKLKKQVKTAKVNSDYVILNLHWGIEYDNYPRQEQINLAHSLVDSGADIIIGHHPHVLQGVEYYKDSIIFYSIGNFNFLISSDNTTQSGVFEINLDKNNLISSRIYPTKIQSCKANLLDYNSSTYNEIINNLNIRSLQFKTKISKEGFIRNDKSM